MADDLTKAGKADAAKINLKQKHEVVRWTKHFNVPLATLIAAVAAVGPEVKKVAEWLKARK